MALAIESDMRFHDLPQSFVFEAIIFILITVVMIAVFAVIDSNITDKEDLFSLILGITLIPISLISGLIIGVTYSLPYSLFTIVIIPFVFIIAFKNTKSDFLALAEISAMLFIPMSLIYSEIWFISDVWLNNFLRGVLAFIASLFIFVAGLFVLEFILNQKHKITRIFSVIAPVLLIVALCWYTFLGGQDILGF